MWPITFSVWVQLLHAKLHDVLVGTALRPAMGCQLDHHELGSSFLTQRGTITSTN